MCLITDTSDQGIYFKFGYTENLYNRMRSLNHNYDCKDQIFLVGIYKCDDSQIERMMHERLKCTSFKANISAGKVNKSREIYYFSKRFYKLFIKLNVITNQSFIHHRKYSKLIELKKNINKIIK